MRLVEDLFGVEDGTQPRMLGAEGRPHDGSFGGQRDSTGADPGGEAPPLVLHRPRPQPSDDPEGGAGHRAGCQRRLAKRHGLGGELVRLLRRHPNRRGERVAAEVVVLPPPPLPADLCPVKCPRTAQAAVPAIRPPNRAPSTPAISQAGSPTAAPSKRPTYPMRTQGAAQAVARIAVTISKTARRNRMVRR